MLPEYEPRSAGVIPPIAEETRKQVVDELGMTPGAEKRGFTPDLRRKMASNVFRTLAQINRPLVQTIQKAIKENLYPGDHSERTCCAEGMGVVLRAYDIEESYDLTERFSMLQSDDLGRVEGIVREILKGPENSKQRDLLEEILEGAHLPEHEVNLNAIVDRAKNASGLGDIAVEQGAILMYKILSEFKTRLFPGETPQPHPFSQNPQQ